MVRYVADRMKYAELYHQGSWRVMTSNKARLRAESFESSCVYLVCGIRYCLTRFTTLSYPNSSTIKLLYRFSQETNWYYIYGIVALVAVRDHEPQTIRDSFFQA